MFVGQIKVFIKYLPLLFLLVKKDLKLKYRRSVLGYLWSLLSPLLTMLVIAAVFSNLFRFSIPNFPLYLLCGQVIFSFFSEATNSAMTAVIGGGGLIKKVYLPKYIFPLSKVCSALVNALFSMVAVLLVMFFTKSAFYPTIFLVPIPLIYTFIISVGLGLLLSCVSVNFRDIIYIYSVFLTALTYFTPLFYPVSILPDPIKKIIILNPLFHVVDYMRQLILYGQIPGLWENLCCIGFSAFILAFGLYVFKMKQKSFILYI